MGVVKLQEKLATNELGKWWEAFTSERKRRGKTAVMYFEDNKEEPTYRFYSYTETRSILNYIGRTNVYLSLNAFGRVNGQYRAKAENLVQIRNIGVDLDCYKEDIEVPDAEKMLKKMIDRDEIPEPNLIIRSGNGLQLIYSIQDGLPADLFWLTRHVTAQLAMKLTDLGSDMSCTNPNRVFRMPYTFNYKPEHGRKPTNMVLGRRLEYDMSELYAYCEPMALRPPPGSVGRPKRAHLPKQTEKGWSTLSLNQARINDFYKLVELRSGDIKNRNVMTYDFAYILGLFHESDREVVMHAQRFNLRFKVPQPITEVERTARNAFKDARKFWKAFEDAEYNMNALIRPNDGIVKPKKSQTIIDAHNISDEEMKHLLTLVTKEESYNRKVAKRRENGVKERSEYEKGRQEDKQQKIEEVRCLLAENPKMKQKDIAELMGVNRKTVSRWCKEL